jgi:hypothetical protein
MPPFHVPIPHNWLSVDEHLQRIGGAECGGHAIDLATEECPEALRVIMQGLIRSV